VAALLVAACRRQSLQRPVSSGAILNFLFPQVITLVLPFLTYPPLVAASDLELPVAHHGF
jgi:hypothetical protein